MAAEFSFTLQLQAPVWEGKLTEGDYDFWDHPVTSTGTVFLSDIQGSGLLTLQWWFNFRESAPDFTKYEIVNTDQPYVIPLTGVDGSITSVRLDRDHSQTAILTASLSPPSLLLPLAGDIHNLYNIPPMQESFIGMFNIWLGRGHVRLQLGFNPILLHYTTNNDQPLSQDHATLPIRYPSPP
jgi:hypothetical protein